VAITSKDELPLYVLPTADSTRCFSAAPPTVGAMERKGRNVISDETRDAERVHLDKPSAARMYDYFLGGFHNTAVDRQAAEAVKAIYPDAPLVMRANRAFLRRAVTFLIERGITQFLDLGAGIPTVGNVHEVAEHLHPGARVVYVDIDPVAVNLSTALLAGNPDATAILADVRQPTAIFAHPEVRRLLDLERPLGVLLVSVLPFLKENEEAYRAVDAICGAVAPGSYLAVSHHTDDDMPPDIAAQTERLYAGTTNPSRYRTHAEIARFFANLTLVEPGLVYAPLWRPEPLDDLFLRRPERAINLAGVGIKPFPE